jgi:periplasmic divalent cation tolerance protein
VQHREQSDILIVTTTVASRDDAVRLARALADARLAACVQLDDITSHYRWEGRGCEDAEVRLTIKSIPEAREALDAFLAARHPYELPQVVAWTAAASPAYAAWVKGEVSVPQGAGRQADTRPQS